MAEQTPEQREAARKAEEKAQASKTGAVEGAQSVAEAVKRVADAAVAEVQKVPTRGGAAYDFDVTGSVGGRFVISGNPGDFGTGGTVTLGGVQLNTRAWSSQRIEGDLPAGVKAGEVVVHVDSNTTKRGYFRG